MNRRSVMKLDVRRALVFALMLGTGIAPVQAAKYTYHGDLMDGDAPARGAYDLRVRSFANPDASKALGEAIELPGVALVDGRFNVELDLPEDADGTTWVEVAVRTAGSNEAFETLGNPQPLSKVNSTCPGAWALDGNMGIPSGSFLGTADPDPLEFRVNNRRVMQIHADGSESPSIAGGSPANVASLLRKGQTIAGGGKDNNNSCGLTGQETCGNYADADYATIGGGFGNRALGESSVTSGGASNGALAPWSTVAGGRNNFALGNDSVVGGGVLNRAVALNTVVGGGQENTANGTFAVVAGGASNSANGDGSSVGGGSYNCAGGNRSWVGGSLAVTRSGNEPGDVACAGAHSGDADGDEGSFVWADQSGGTFASTGPNQFAIRASGGLRWAGTGVNSTISPAFTHRVNTAASGGNTCTGGSGVGNSRTSINHPLLNGNPNAVIVMTPNYGSTVDGVAPPRHPMGVYFNAGADGNCAAGRWVIYDVTTVPETLNNGAMFNVWFVLP